MKILLLSLVTFLSLFLTAQPAASCPGVWSLAGTTTAAYTFNRGQGVAFIIGSKLYYGWGVDSLNLSAQYLDKKIYELDLSDLNGTPVVHTPPSSLNMFGAAGAVAVVINDKAYICAGYSGFDSKKVWEFDPSSDSWRAMADYPGAGGTGVRNLTGASLGGYGYFGSGKYYSSSLYYYNNDLRKFDPNAGTNGSWSVQSASPGNQVAGGVCLVGNNQLFIGQGYKSDCMTQDNMYAFTPMASSTGTWSTSPLTAGAYFGRENAAGFTLYGRWGFVCGGADVRSHPSSGTPTYCYPNVGFCSSDVFLFDLVTGTYVSPNTPTTMPAAIGNAAMAYNDTSAYLIGGVNNSGSYVSSIYKYTNTCLASASTGVDLVAASSIHLSPNPATSSVLISTDGVDIPSIKILDIDGRLLLESKEKLLQVDVSHFTPGIYLVETTIHDRVYRERFVKY